MLVHICCSVDSHFFLEKLQRDYPAEKLRGFFYDPNIHPYSEYRLRLLDVQRSCKKLGIELIEGEYDYGTWLEAVRGLEREPEKGERCAVCFDRRFEVSAHKALELGEQSFTTTLLVSPLKSQEQLKRSGAIFEAAHGVRFIAPDYRSGGGTQDQSRVTKEQQLYRQDYCGCLFGLSMQREAQERLSDELFSPLHGGVLLGSIEERLALYARRMELEDQGIDYRIVKEKFLNYRLFTCKLTLGKNSSVPVHALPYSTLPRGRAQGKIEQIIANVAYLNREEVRFITLEHYNALAGTDYLHVTALIFHPPTQEQELNIRQKLTCNPYDLTPIMVVDHLFTESCSIVLDAKIYEDTRERLITL